MQALNDTTDQIYLTDIYRTFDPKTAEYTFFSIAHGIFSRISSCAIDQALINFKKLQLFQACCPTTMLCDYKSTKKKKKAKNTNSWKLNNILLNNKWIIEEIKEEIQRFLETDDNEDIKIQNLWDTAKAILRGKFRAIQSYLRREEKAQINNLTLHLKLLGKEEQTSPKLVEGKKS